MPTTEKRPAHRPSRRAAVVDAAMQLFAATRSEEVTVAEIAEAAGMTSAAVYYHFASKDDILLEGLRAVGEALAAETRDLLQELASSGESVAELPGRLLAWADGRREVATVWFVYSSGVSLSVESLRREIRTELIELLTLAVRTERSGTSAPEAAVLAVALLALIEVSAASWLTKDESVIGLGRKGFVAETRAVAERILRS